MYFIVVVFCLFLLNSLAVKMCILKKIDEGGEKLDYTQSLKPNKNYMWDIFDIEPIHSLK